MNIYFSCSITGGRDDQSAYRSIVDALLSTGHIVPTAVLADEDVLDYERSISAEEIYSRDIHWLDECDAVVAEVSTPSHGVGYEIAYALLQGKPVLCGYRADKKISKMLEGNSHSRIRVISYHQVDEFIQAIDAFLHEVSKGKFA